MAVEEVKFCKNELGNQVLGSFQCAKVERTGKVKLISPEYVINQACLIHDCSTGRCCFGESETTVTIEKEPVKKVTYCREMLEGKWKHVCSEKETRERSVTVSYY